MKLVDRRDMYNGFGDTLAKAFELVLTPMIFGFFGWLLDRKFDTKPIFMLVLFLVVFAYEVWKLWSAYESQMQAHEEKLLGPRGSAAGAMSTLVEPRGEAPEVQVARDIARRAIPVAVVLVAISGAIWGVHGALSSAFSVGLVVLNFLAAAAVIAWGARISLNVLMGTVLLGYIARLALILIALVLVKDASWVERTPLFATLLVTHLGLLMWEARYVSLSLAYPGLKPTRREGTKEATGP